MLHTEHHTLGRELNIRVPDRMATSRYEYCTAEFVVDRMGCLMHMADVHFPASDAGKSSQEQPLNCEIEAQTLMGSPIRHTRNGKTLRCRRLYSGTEYL